MVIGIYKQLFKFNNFISIIWRQSLDSPSGASKKSVRMGQSLRAGAQIFLSSLFCIGSGVRLFQDRFLCLRNGYKWGPSSFSP